MIFECTHRQGEGEGLEIHRQMRNKEVVSTEEVHSTKSSESLTRGLGDAEARNKD